VFTLHYDAPSLGLISSPAVLDITAAHGNSMHEFSIIHQAISIHVNDLLHAAR
jgi:hypothetical protein